MSEGDGVGARGSWRLLPPPQGVQTGEMMDICSGTSWTLGVKVFVCHGGHRRFLRSGWSSCDSVSRVGCRSPSCVVVLGSRGRRDTSGLTGTPRKVLSDWWIVLDVPGRHQSGLATALRRWCVTFGDSSRRGVAARSAGFCFVRGTAPCRLHRRSQRSCAVTI